MPPKPLYDISGIDLTREAVPLDEVQSVNPQRFEFMQVTRIAHIDDDEQVIVGVRELAEDEFWVRGHIPGRPLFPGVLMCEAAAQVATFMYVKLTPEIAGRFVGFGGLDRVRFRGTVAPGDTLVIVARAERMRPRQGVFATQGLVDGELVFEAKVIGVPMPEETPEESPGD